VAEQQPQHHHLPLRVAEPRRRLQRVRGWRPPVGGLLRPGHPPRLAPLGDRVAGQRDQPGAEVRVGVRSAGAGLAAGGDREPGERGAEHLLGQLLGGGPLAGPRQQVAVDPVHLHQIEPRERLPVAAGGPLQQRALAGDLGGDVAAAAGARGRPGGRGAVRVDAHALSG
jgi:hypothetical protein